LALFIKYVILKAVTRNSSKKYEIKNTEMQEKNGVLPSNFSVVLGLPGYCE
jgi:hypothetical protein